METAAPTIRALELENQKLRVAKRESDEAILELQREACARDGVPMPSERPLVDKLRDENQRLRADVAELVEALNRALPSVEHDAQMMDAMERHAPLPEADMPSVRRAANVLDALLADVRTVLAKHGA